MERVQRYLESRYFQNRSVLIPSRHINPDSPLDVYSNGIRQKFNRLNQELDEAI